MVLPYHMCTCIYVEEYLCNLTPRILQKYIKYTKQYKYYWDFSWNFWIYCDRYFGVAGVKK